MERLLETEVDQRLALQTASSSVPATSGSRSYRRVRALPSARTASIPAAALTAFAREEDRRQALAAGFQLHVAKPVDAGSLVSAVATLLGRMHAL